MKLRAPTVGPIVGYTTPTETRIWLRGDLQRTADSYRRAFGAVRIRAAGTRAWSAPVFTKLQPHFDVTGICVLTGLSPATEHEYQAGWFHSDAELSGLSAAMPLDWTAAAQGAVRTSIDPDPVATSASTSASRRYAIGSCRYLLRLFDDALVDERGDKTFRSILAQHERPESRYDALLMLGDQIYADDLGPVGADRTVDDYLARYRLVFSQPAIRRLMSLVPSYMILDDHEIENDWPRLATAREKQTLYPAAIHAYQVYQASHSPLFPLSSERRVDGTPEWLWYSFRDGCCDWFVMDTRTERRFLGSADKNVMIDDRQKAALFSWLTDGSGQVKMIASAVPIIPDVVGKGEDKWTGFRGQRAEILKYIFTKKVPRVVFVSGDVHCSFVAELTSPRHRGQKVSQVVSSSFFWPYPQKRTNRFLLDAKLAVPKGGGDYRVKGLSEVIATDNFGRVEVSRSGVRVRYFGRKGGEIGSGISVEF